MRRTASASFWSAIVSVILTPLGMVHAHVADDHEHVVVHGGHSHGIDFDSSVHEHDDGHDHEHDNPDPQAHRRSDCLMHSAPHASGILIEIEWSSAAPDARGPGKIFFLPYAQTRAPPLTAKTPIACSSRSDTEFISRRPYLHPPLRGPPASIF